MSARPPRRRNTGWPIVLGLAVAALAGAGAAERAGAVDFTDLGQWAAEQLPGGTVTVRDGAVEIEDQAGCTLWWRTRLTAPVEISYTVTAISRGGPHDRVSDVNCFWMANQRDSAAPPFAAAHARSGKFSDYDSLLTYYVGYGGNNNTTTRFRRYDGTAARPLRPEHDLTGSKLLLEPNRPIHIRLVARHGGAEFWRNGERIFTYQDPSPLTSGWFALRTVRSHLRIENLRFSVPAAAP